MSTFVLMHLMSNHGTVTYLNACLLKQTSAIFCFNSSCTYKTLTRLLCKKENCNKISSIACMAVQIKTMAQELGIAFLTAGFDPKWAVKDVPIMPKNRYR